MSKVIRVTHGDRPPLTETTVPPGENVTVDCLADAWSMLGDPAVSGVWLDRDCFPQVGEISGLLHSHLMLRDMPEGVALLDADLKVLWANRRLLQWAGQPEGTPISMTFFQLLRDPEIMGPDFCPFHTALATDDDAHSQLQSDDGKYFQVHAAAIRSPGSEPQLIVTVTDITEEILQQQKLAAIHQAGRELADIRPGEIFMMDVDDRIALLTGNIRRHLAELLNFEYIEIRVLEQSTGQLLPLLSVGIDQEAANRKLKAASTHNGITGFVAAQGQSYICPDVSVDSLYLTGIGNARSSLTVPLMLHDQILGTINVESPEVAAFSETDEKFLEIFARDVAVALNTLELLAAQRADTAEQSCNAIHSAVALSVDEILNDAVSVMEAYEEQAGEQTPTVFIERLGRILRNAREIKDTIQEIGRRLSPAEAVPVSEAGAAHKVLVGKRVLVVDADDQVRASAHQLLERYGCIVETAHDGTEALSMARTSRNSRGGFGYDVFISDIQLREYSGYQLMRRLQTMIDPVPMILMTGFGYDPGHSIVQAKQNGLHPKAVLYKPFRLDQLIEVLETVLEATAGEGRSGSVSA